MESRRTTFRIRRFDPARDHAPRYDEYAIDVPEGMTVLEALLRIQAEQDGTLAFRYACRGAVCGSCAMVLNGEVALACRAQVQELPRDVVTVEPLPRLPLVRDLIVDMDVFLDRDRAVIPWLVPRDEEPERERLVSPDEWKKAEPYTNCILCASCRGVCPVAARQPAYLGPAALAKHYRFLADVRDAADAERVALVDGEHGVWGCDVVWNCVKVCPKRVPPTKGILATRDRIESSRGDGGG
jgi:succinate dehydrogenase / fumarate reductase iron-sulfur subunit